MKILTAYKEGGIYKKEHIERLRWQVQHYSGYDLTVVNGTFPHWWCKLNIFRVPGPVLYFDLDTTIVDDIQPLMEAAKSERFIIGRNWNKPSGVASGVMAWKEDMSHLYEEFAESPQKFMNEYPGGDQDFIGDRVTFPTIWDDLLPNHIQSYKIHVRRNGIHPDCRVVAFHGSPRPWQLDELEKE